MRKRSLVAALGLLLALLEVLPGTAVAATPRGRTGVGDSIMLSSEDELQPFRIDVHARVGRQFSGGLNVVRRLVEDGRLAKRVVVHLGTNGPIDAGDCHRLVRLVGRTRRVFLVTNKVPRWWEGANNDLINACAAAHEKVHAVRWWSYSHRHEKWFADDGFHLTARGQGMYAAFIDARVDEVLRSLRMGASTAR